MIIESDGIRKLTAGFKEMIIYVSQGQLGNQLFQYAFLKNHCRPGEIILTLGFDNLLEVFEIEDKIVNIPKNKITRYLKALKFILVFLGKIRLITYLKPEVKELKKGYVKEDVHIKKTTGIIRGIKFVKTGSYESEIHFPENLKDDIKIKNKFVLKAKEFLDSIESNDKIFIHIRLGDYDDYTVFGESVKLPMEYYHKAINNLQDRLENPVFIFLSNNPHSVQEKFMSLNSKRISRNEYGTDFTIMTLCQYGVVSASTFSYWGAYLMENRMEVYAPKFWKGFRSDIEYPKKGFPSFAIPLEVNS